jgi:hypothetical protein
MVLSHPLQAYVHIHSSVACPHSSAALTTLVNQRPSINTQCEVLPIMVLILLGWLQYGTRRYALLMCEFNFRIR